MVPDCRLAIYPFKCKEIVMSAEVQKGEPAASVLRGEIEITVNFKPVRLHERKVTGLEIKEAAIAQGVNIKPDFVLFEDKGQGQRKVIGDQDEVHIHPGSK